MKRKQWLSIVIVSVILLLLIRLGYLLFVKEWFSGVSGLQSVRSQTRIYNKPILIYIYDPHAPLGKIFEEQYLKRPVIQELLKSYYKVRINGSIEGDQLASGPFPTLIIMAPGKRDQQLLLLRRKAKKIKLISPGRVKMFLIQGLLTNN